MNPEELAVLITQQTGKKVSGWVPCHLLNDELVALSAVGPNADEWYFGDFVIHSTEGYFHSATAQNIGAVTGDQETMLFTNDTGQKLVNSSLKTAVLWNKISSWDYVSGHFYGYKFTRQKGYVVQSYTLTPGAGWTESGGDYTHTVGSGTTEQIYLGAWALNSLIRVTVTFTGITQGSLSLEMDTSGTFGTISEDGTYTFVVQTTGTDGALFFVPTTDFDGTYNEDSVIIEKYT